MANRKIAIQHFVLFLAFEIRKSTFGNSCGGIAQLVERQLCKLEVRGSNPLASKIFNELAIQRFSEFICS
jgi:hypothetical protein